MATARGRAVQTEKRVSSHSSMATLRCLLSILCLIAPTAMAYQLDHRHDRHHHHVKTASGPVTRYFDFDISLVNFTRNCVTKPIVVVNGQYPGPTLNVNEGDRVVVKVTNNVQLNYGGNGSGNGNITIHWHGVRQLLSSWQDGVGYITQCSIQPGDYFVYDFVVRNQSGTTFWHAHVNWIRATVHGAFVTRPLKPYPFPKPAGEFPIILGEWWNSDVAQVEDQALLIGIAFNVSDALTINGWPGPQYSCSSDPDEIANVAVEHGKTYLLRLINAALNSAMYFGVADHTLTVVEVDSNYVEQLSVKRGVYIAPGQTMSILVTADQTPSTYYAGAIAVSSLLITDPGNIPAVALPFALNDVPRIPTTALFRYIGSPPARLDSLALPDLPEYNHTEYRDWFEDNLKTLHPECFPTGPNIRHLFYAVGTASQPCTAANPCLVSPPYRVAAAINNVTFQQPTIAILQAYFFHISGVYTTNFPDTPPHPYDYTAADTPPNPLGGISELGTRVTQVSYGTTIQLILQDDNNFAFESHPFHLHGFFFYVLGRGRGVYNASTDSKNFNLVNPPARFTVDVPERGWVAIRFKADNPGVWLLHCHLDKHTTWGMQTAFIVENGIGPSQTLPDPPARLIPC